LYTKLLHGGPAAASGNGCVSHPAIADKEGKTDSAYNTADTVNTKYIQRVVVSEFVLNNDREIAEARCEDTEEQGTQRLENTSSGGDGNETCEDTTGKSQRGCLTLMDAFDDNPRQSTGCSCNLCCSKSLCRAQSTGKTATCVESEPTYPEEPGTDHGHDEVIRTHGKVRVKFSSTDKDGSNKTAHAGRDVHHSTTGKVDSTSSTQFEQEAIACPYAVCKGIVYENSPPCDEPAVCFERDAFSKS